MESDSESLIRNEIVLGGDIWTKKSSQQYMTFV